MSNDEKQEALAKLATDALTNLIALQLESVELIGAMAKLLAASTARYQNQALLNRVHDHLVELESGLTRLRQISEAA